MKNLLRYIILIIISSSAAYSQFFSNLLNQAPNNVNFGFDKYANTITFIGNANLYLSSQFGNIYFKQNYSGTSITSANSFRDDEIMMLSYNIPIIDNIYFNSEFNWNLNADTRSIGFNELERLNALAGFSYLPLQNMKFSAIYGLEDNTQIGISSAGTILKANALFENQDFGGYLINSNINTELLRLKNNRQNSDFSFNANAYKDFDLQDNIGLDLNYKYLSRDFVISSFTQIDDYLIENRAESRIGAMFNVNYKISKLLNTSIDFAFNNLEVSRSFKEYFAQEIQTGISRNLSELQLNFGANIKYQSEDFSQEFVVRVNTRDEKNFVENKYEIDDNDLIRLRNIENQRDNNSSINSLYSTTIYNLNRYDNIKAEYNLSLLRYDTQSESNNDDRDEFSTKGKLTYHKKFSQFLSMDLIGELQMLHLVFIKSQRSALNNWNRIIKLAPVIYLSYDSFEMSPKLEVLANYTVFDFESVNPNVNSFSFRQISYRDSIKIKITDKINLSSRLVYRYFERGILYWNEFKESPQSSNQELLADILLNTKISDNIILGYGIKYYNLNQQNLGVNSSLILEQESIGPQVNLSAQFLSTSIINLTGWYEFQRAANGAYREIPNIYLNTSIKI